MDEKRLINIILLLFSKNLELVIAVPNQWENRDDPCFCQLNLGKMCVFDLKDDEADWLINDEIVELETGSDDPDMEYRYYAYRMTPDARTRLKKIVREIIEKRKKITAT